jgi:hypothetical protein
LMLNPFRSLNFGYKTVNMTAIKKGIFFVL